MQPTPVFLISFNRGPMLRTVIAAIRRLSRPTEIIIHDNGSSDPETLRILGDLEAGGISVARHPPIAQADDLNLVDRTVQAWFAGRAKPVRYVVSDCDVDLSVADPRALDVYDWLLDNVAQAACVGPMLRIGDIPPSYPLYNRVMNRHIEQFWRHRPSIIRPTPFGDVAVLGAMIDTTFALHRAGEPFRRMKPALRVYAPFEALHLDWYRVDTESAYATTSNPAIAHWDNTVKRAAHRTERLAYGSYYDVRPDAAGGLEACVVTLPAAIEVRPAQSIPPPVVGLGRDADQG
jgi:hypothetical protein